MEISNFAKQTTYNKNGYTLIEILVVLTIIGLLFNFGYVSFRDFSRRQAIIGAAKTIQGDLRLAQSDAITGQKPKDGSCDSPKTLDSFSFNVRSVSPTARYTIDANCGATVTTVKDVTLASGITISANPTPNPLQFKILAQGTNIVTDDWTITLVQAGTGNTATVTVTSGGEIK